MIKFIESKVNDIKTKLLFFTSSRLCFIRILSSGDRNENLVHQHIKNLITETRINRLFIITIIVLGYISGLIKKTDTRQKGEFIWFIIVVTHAFMGHWPSIERMKNVIDRTYPVPWLPYRCKSSIRCQTSMMAAFLFRKSPKKILQTKNSAQARTNRCFLWRILLPERLFCG